MLTRALEARHAWAEACRERGAVAVEFALVLPILVMLMFGIFTSGVAYSDHLSITNAVREAARLGAAVAYEPASPSVWADSVQSRTQQVYFNAGSTLASSQICVQLVSAAGAVVATPTSQGTTCGTAPGSPSDLAAGSCIVKVWVQKPGKISLLVFPDLNFTLGAQSVSYYGRTVGSCTAA